MIKAPQIFLSYFKEDFEQAQELHNNLTEHGLSVWWDKDLKVGDEWSLKIQRAIENCDIFVVCLSEQAITRNRSYLYKELDLIANRLCNLKPTGELPLFPVRLSDCELPDLKITTKKSLRDIQHLDLFPESKWQRGLEEIVEQALQMTKATHTALNTHETLPKKAQLAQYFEADEFNIPSRWYWEVIQDIVSIALDIPIQIFPEDALERLFRKIPTGHFTDYGNFRAFVMSFSGSPKGSVDLLKKEEDLVDAIIRAEDSVCITRPSNTYSLLSSFRRRSKFWRCRDQVWALRSVCNPKADKPVYLDAEDDSKPLFEAYVLPMKKTNAVMLAGPVWTEASKATGQTFQKERIDKAIELFKIAVCDINTTPILDLFRLGCIGAKRVPILQQDLRGRSKAAVLAIESIANLEVHAGNIFFRRCDLVQIAEWICAMLYLDTQWENRRPTPRRAEHSFNNQFISRLSNHKNVTAYSLDHSTVIEGESQKRNLWIISDWPLRPLSQSRRRLVDADTVGTFKLSELTERRLQTIPDEEDLDIGISQRELSIRVERQLMSINARKNAYKGEDLGLLSDILANEFGSLIDFSPLQSPRRESGNSHGGPEEVADIICRYTQRRLLSDVCAIYYYDYPRRALKYRGSKIHESFNWKSKTTSLAERMQFASGNQTLRNDSMSYRAIDEGCKQFVRSTEIKQDNPHNRLLSMPGELPIGRSGAAVLLRHCGRPFGVMELVGRRPFQFRWDNLLSLKEIADVSSSYFYPRAVAHYLGMLSREYLTEFADELRCYKTICKYSCRIILGAAAALWVQETADPDLFRCVASYNRKDLEKIRSQNDTAFNFSASKDSAVTGELIRDGDQDTVVVEGKIGEGRFGEKWLSEVQNRALRESEIKLIAVIPIRDKEKRIIASLTVYKNDQLEYDNRWHRLIEFLSQQCSSLVDHRRRLTGRL